MAELRIWNIEGRDFAFCDPPSWEYMPKMQLTVDVLNKRFMTALNRSQCTVLDVGCFTAYLLRGIQTYGYQCAGVDLHGTLLQHLSTRFDMDLKFGNAESLPFPDASMNAVVMLDVLEHTFDDIQAIREAKRVLKPAQTSILIINVPLAYEGYLDTAHEHLRMYTKDSLYDILSPHFRHVKTLPCNDEYGYPTLFTVCSD